MLPTFETLDRRIRYYHLMLEGPLDAVSPRPLPEGYRFVPYRDGDRDAWIDIEISAGELSSHAHGLEVWRRYYGDHEAELPGRMLFLADADGNRIGTATAYYDVFGNDTSGDGWLHWVGLRREHQGKGLSKPLVARALARLAELGYARAKISTQTTTWLACKVYLDFGFRPTAESAVESRDGWRIVRRLTGHPALSGFDAAEDALVLAEASHPEES